MAESFAFFGGNRHNFICNKIMGARRKNQSWGSGKFFSEAHLVEHEKFSACWESWKKISSTWRFYKFFIKVMYFQAYLDLKFSLKQLFGLLKNLMIALMD